MSVELQTKLKEILENSFLSTISKPITGPIPTEVPMASITPLDSILSSQI